MAAVESKFWGPEILGIYSLSDRAVFDFAQKQFADSEHFSDPKLLGELLGNKSLKPFKNLKPQDMSGMVMSAANSGFYENGEQGFAQVFVNPDHPNDPNYAAVVYFVKSGDQRADGKIPLSVKKAIVGEKANIVMVYQNPCSCCPQMGVMLDYKQDGKNRNFQMRDGHDAGHKQIFAKADAQGKMQPLVDRILSDADLAAHRNTPNLVHNVTQMRTEMGHIFMHALGVKHECSSHVHHDHSHKHNHG